MPAPRAPSVHAPAPRRPIPSSRRNPLPADDQLSAVPSVVSVGDRSISRCSSPRDVPSRLMSPIRLIERRSRLSCSGSPPPSCSTTKRRRTPHLSRTATRARHCRHPDCGIIRGDPAIFDQQPAWFSVLNQEPTPDLLQPWSFADLSLLPEEKHGSVGSGAGPIRSRKSSLRSAPFPTDVSSITPELTPSLSPQTPLSEIPFCSDGISSMNDDVLKTPPPRVSLLSVNAGFHNLMPVAFADVEEPWWQNELPSS
ncbi:hypothetical protein DFH11DRAFT_1687390 [Phellopilus nigrolimitatus]|nr:hypothetical protein DFH11DRAFT_1687390 [Phellopilus nigrolimitatus]